MSNDLIFLIISIIIIFLIYNFLFKNPPEIKRKKLFSNKEIEKEKLEMEKEIQKNLLKQRDDNIIENKKKEMLRERKKEEKRQRQEELRQKIEQQRKKNEEKEKLIEEKERKEKIEEEKKLLKLKKIEEEKKLKEENEYNKWKNLIQVEDVGEENDKENNNESLVNKFIEYIKLRKVVTLEDLSNTFNLKTKDILDRIKSLEQGNTFNVIIDDNGKIIYLENEEIENLIKLLKRKGRFNKSQLITEFSKIINLEPSKENMEKIKLEENKYKNLIEKDLEEDK